MADAHPDKSKSKSSKGLLKANNTANKANKKSKGRTSTKATSSASNLQEDGELFDTDDEMDQDNHSPHQHADEMDHTNGDDNEDKNEDNASQASVENVVRILPSLPGINDTTMTNVTAMVPGFVKAVNDARSVRAMIDHFAEKATCGTLDEHEKAEYESNCGEYIELVKNVKQCLNAYKHLQSLSLMMGSAPAGGQNNPTAGPESNASAGGFTVLQQQLRDHPGILTQVSPSEIKQFRRKWATALQQVST